MVSTKIVKIDPVYPQQEYIKEAVAVLENGGLVIMPTETVYGIAADAFNKKTLQRLRTIKQRPEDKPFSLHLNEKYRVEDFAIDIPVSAYKLISKFWPGPLTLVLKAKDRIRNKTNPNIGLRMPDNEIALRIIAQAKVPLICPSANISGKPAPVDFQEAMKDLQGLVDFAIDAGTTRLKMESSVVDLTVEPLVMLREAAIKKEEIEDVVKKKTILFVCTGNSCRSVMAKGLLDKKLKEQGRADDIEVLSAGIMILSGLSATQETSELLGKEGIDVSNHRSQRVTKEIVKKSDIILVMEKLHEERILQLAPEVKNRLFLLKEFANPVRNTHSINLAKISNGTKINSNSLNITDPIGKSMEFYAQTFKIIKEAVERISNII